MRMNCEEVKGMIGPAADNELPNSDLARVNEHLSSCTDCRTEWDKVIAVKTAIRDIAAANDMNAGFEEKILQALRAEQPRRSNRSFYVIAGAIAAGLLALFFVGRPTEQLSERPVAGAVNAEKLVVGLNHHSDKPEDRSFDVNFVDTIDPVKLSSLAGFEVQPVSIESFDASGADIVKSDKGKTLVRVCYVSANKKYRTCIDCYQAPQGTIAFGGGSEEVINGRKVRINQVDNQSFLMVSHKGVDVVYSAAMPRDELLSLLKPSV